MKRFYLLLGSIAGVLLLGAYLGANGMWTNQYAATALLRVASHGPAIVFSTDDKLGGGEVDFQTFRRNQQSLIKSHFVLTAALKRPGIAQLPLVKAQEPDLVAWLQQRLEVSYPDDGEILQIRLTGVEGQQDQLVKLVEAVTKAYLREVVQRHRVDRMQGYDQVVLAYEDLQDELDEEMRHFQQRARESGGAESELAGVELELARFRLKMLETRRLVVEKQIDAAAPDTDQFTELTKRLDKLDHDFEEVASRMKQSVQRDIDLQRLKAEIDLRSELAREIGRKKQRWEVELNAPERVTLIQPATIARVLEAGR